MKHIHVQYEQTVWIFRSPIIALKGDDPHPIPHPRKQPVLFTNPTPLCKGQCMDEAKWPLLYQYFFFQVNILILISSNFKGIDTVLMCALKFITSNIISFAINWRDHRSSFLAIMFPHEEENNYAYVRKLAYTNLIQLFEIKLSTACSFNVDSFL